jgi:predicted nucleic acid-binding protein
LKVVDSSYLIERLLKRKELFVEEDFLVTLDLAMYEVANSIWKHEFLLKDIKDGFEYVSILQGLIESGLIQLFQLSKDLIKVAYSIAAEKKRSVYDAVFVSLALELNSELSTFDKRQRALFESYS